MSYPVTDAILRVRRILEDYPYETLNTSDPGTATVGEIDTFTVTDGSKWSEGDVVEFQDNGEACYVRSVSSNTLTVLRGYDGTTPTVHAINTRVLKNPTFRYSAISDSIRHTINGLWPNVWKKIELTLTPAGEGWYDLNSEVIQLSTVTQTRNDLTELVYYGADGAPAALLRRNVPTTLAPSTVGLLFPQGLVDVDDPIYVTAIGRITDQISGSAFLDLDNTGIEIECVAYGAAAKLMMAKEVVRVSGEDVTQSDQSVTPLRRAQVSAALEARHVALRNDWHYYLMETVPPMSRWY